MRRHFRQPDRRRGVVLIIVVGVLAVLMLMAGTLALLSRLGHQMSVSYDQAQALDALTDAVQTYATGILYQDKYGADGLPYDYERQGTAYPTSAPYYPPMSTALWGDDEGFDSFNEEWLPGPASDGWRMFPTTTYSAASWLLGDYGVRVDLDGDGTYDEMVEWRPYTALDPRGPNRYGPLTGTNLSARVSLYFEDMGGARIDINAAGNVLGNQNQGLTPFELNLAAVTVSPASLISARQGGDGPGGLTGWLPGIVDRDADGTIGGDAARDFTRYSPLYPEPTSNDAPFGDFDLNDLFQLSNDGSPAAGILAGDFLGYFTTQSAGTNMVGRSLRSSDAWDSTAREFLLNSEFLSRSNGGAVPTARPLNEVLLKMSPREIAAFLESLGPVAHVGGLDVSADTRVTRQIATNLKDMVDADSTVCVWTDEGGFTYYGIEPTPSIVEAEAAVPTWYVPGDPPTVSYLGQYGKYIKLVNPWNVPILLDDFRMVLPHDYQGRPRLRQWVQMTDGVGGTHNTVCSVPVDADVVISLAGKVIPARGHFIIAQDQATVDAMTGGGLSSNLYTIDSRLRYMQECVGQPLGEADRYKLLHYSELTAPFNTGDYIYTRSVGGGSGLNGRRVAMASADGEWLLVEFLDETENVNANELLYDSLPAEPPVRQPNGRAVGVAEPIYDLFEVQADSTTYETWIQDNAPADAFGHEAGAASAVGLFQVSADTYIMFTVLPDSPVDSEDSDDDEDDWPLMTSALSGQMDDPRPCWYRYNPETDAYEEPSDPLAADAPWSANAWDRLDKTWLTLGTWGTATDAAAWYNSNWLNASMRHAPGGALPGDGWNALWDDVAAVPLPDSLLFSFPPVLQDDGSDGIVPCYTGASGQQTAVQNRGLLPNPGSVGFVHAGLPWTTLSLRWQYGAAEVPPADRVYVPGLLDYVAGPRGPYESRAAHRGELSLAAPDLLAAGTGPRAVAAGDFNGDGRVDIAAANEGTSDLTVYYNMGNGAFRRDTTSYGLAAGAHGGLAAADLDRDGYADVVVSNAASASVSVFLGGAGGLGTRSDYGVGSTPRGLTIRDLNGDGRLDVAVACDNGVNVLLGQGGGALGGLQNYGAGTSPSDVAAGDFNGDGRLDLAVANEGDDNVTILLGQPAGGFAAAPGSPHTVGNAPAAIAVGDFGGYVGAVLLGTPNGTLDVVTANYSDGTVTLLYGAGDGTFGAGVPYSIGSAPSYLIAGDFNGDGMLDVASGVNGPYAAFLPGRTVGGFGTAQFFQTGATDAAGVAAADFDGNGTLDLAVAKPSDDYVAVLRSTADTSRICGRINVNTASAAVLAAVFNGARASGIGVDPATAAAAIETERNTNGPFTSLDDFFDRMGPDLMPDTGGVYGFRSEALARFMGNLITTRTDVWGVRGRMQLFRDLNADDQYDPAAGDEIVAERNFYMVVDRSQSPIRTLLMRYPPQP
jgi:hypothetical protein